MKGQLIACLTLACSLAQGATSLNAADLGIPAQSGFGAGVMIGEPTGVSVKYWLDERSAIDGVVGWSFEGRNDLHLHADYLYHIFDLIDVGRDRFAVYFGGGVRYKLVEHRSDWFGLRGVGGVAYLFQEIPVDVFLELGPVFDLTPDTRLTLGAGVGARFWF
jgi:hypothetical protein